MKQSEKLRQQIADKLAEVERELAQVDGAEANIRKAATDMHTRYQAQLDQRQGGLPENDDDYLYLLRQRRAAAQVGALAEKERWPKKR